MHHGVNDMVRDMDMDNFSMKFLCCTTQPSMDFIVVQCGTAMDVCLIHTGTISVQIQTEKWWKLAISNYAMLIMYANTHASVLKEEDISRPPLYFQ